MARVKLYRSCVAAGLGAAVLLSAACSEQMKDRKTIKVEQTERWNLAKISVQYQLAQQQYAVGDYDKCRQTLAEALAVNQPHAGLQMLAGKVDIEKGALESAAAHLKEAIRITPTDPEPYYLLGVVYQRWQKFDVAQDYYQQAWDRKASEARYLLAVVEMKITQGQLDEAEQLLEDKMMYFEQTAAVRIALARIATVKKDYAAASKHFRDAYLLLPDDGAVKRSYADALFFAGRYADAVPLLEDIRTHPRVEEGQLSERTDADKLTLTLMLGQAYLNLHRPLDARTCFQEVTREHPDNLQAVLGLGKVCLETNELNAALAAGRRVLRSAPRDVQAMVLVAAVQQKQKKWADALATLETAAGIAPKDATVLCMQGVSVLKMGRQDEAVGYFERAIAANPGDAWAAELLARTKPVAAAAVPAAPPAPAAADGDMAEAPAVTTALPKGQ